MTGFLMAVGKELSIHSLTIMGYFTLEKYINGRPLGELERILGYGKGSLAQGADVYALARLPDPNEFELRGYTAWPQGGVPGMQRAGGSFDMNKLKMMVRQEAWSLTGGNRPVKVVPKTGGNSYPVGLGVPQWELVKPVPAYFLKTLNPGEVLRFRKAYEIPEKEKKEEAPQETMQRAPEPAKKKTWIEIELVDEEGNPVPNVRYQLELPDGTKKAGTLAGNGRARVSEIEPGTCKVSFPDLDASAWERA